MARTAKKSKGDGAAAAAAAAPAGPAIGGALWLATAVATGVAIAAGLHFAEGALRGGPTELVPRGSGRAVSEYVQSGDPIGADRALRVVLRDDAHVMSDAEHKEWSRHYMQLASKFDAAKGDGQLGWLFMLAAYDYYPSDDYVLENLVTNYVAAGYAHLAIDEMINVLKRVPGHAGATKQLERLQETERAAWDQYQTPASTQFSGNLPRPQLMLPFSTAVGRWDLMATFPDLQQLNQEFYDATMEAYFMARKEARRANPKITDTELNHYFFRWQMKFLREDGDYWGGYTRLPLFHSLMSIMREAAANLLMTYGYDEDMALRKASHSTIFWASVHTGDSIHEPHNTADSLIGGVYYVSIPENSGKLALFDPRGKSSSMSAPFPDTPNPPFHRSVTVTPKEGSLVLFPGWLIHQVLPSTGLDVSTSRYRISISVNLKGEWQDTASLFMTSTTDQ